MVAPPWNFPFAIPFGGVAAALVAGNAVILKPAPQTVLTASLVASCFRDAGAPDAVVQFLPCPDDEVGRALITHDDVDAVILTGAYDTASLFLGWKPRLRLRAETSGKNAIVITAAADLDLAVRDLVRSAFGHAGQKCSAASLAIVDATVYDSATFRQRLRDATESLRVGPAFDLRTDVGPLIEAPSEKLLRGLQFLDAGESWLVQPRQLGNDACSWSPGVRLGVRESSWFHQTECFGPVLGVMRSVDLGHALRLQNGTPYGLTAGLYSLDPTEIDYWIDRAEAGNLYVNRGTTGAIVRRQPFGGWKRSVVGPTFKAGGPNYVASLCRWDPIDDETDPTDLTDPTSPFEAWAASELPAERDPSGLAAESNVLRWRQLPGPVVVRCGPDVRSADVDVVTAAARALRVCWELSMADAEQDDRFADRIGSIGPARLRVLGSVDDIVRVRAHQLGIPVDESRPCRIAAI